MIYLDTGCFVKLYYPEPDSARIISLIRGQPILYTPLHDLEFSSALQLKLFFKNATGAQISAALQLVETDLKSGVLVRVDTDWANIFREASSLANQHTRTIGCRSLDVLHCAAAKVMAVNTFITTDIRQKQLAMAMNLDLAEI